MLCLQLYGASVTCTNGVGASSCATAVRPSPTNHDDLALQLCCNQIQNNLFEVWLQVSIIADRGGWIFLDRLEFPIWKYAVLFYFECAIQFVTTTCKLDIIYPTSKPCCKFT
mmetsp:Transcript_51643/g.102637  ORF Transcript_51643/g.102637 Transcript_51643/m.102637 type:complete len:112 (-) Transcript_51643:691-1026(-)